MNHLIGQFRLANSYTAPFTQGRIVKTFWDDSALEVKVFVYESGGAVVSEETSGPTVSSNSSRSSEIRNFGYSFCGEDDYSAPGDNLFEFSIDNIGASGTVLLIFPYTKIVQSNNHFSCSLVPIVCDIVFDTSATNITPDSGSGGQINVRANTSHGEPRYSIEPNASYDTSFPAEGSFYSLTAVAGTYTIYAVDEYGCKTQLTVIVPSTATVYGVRFRLEYTDFQMKGSTRLDIEEKNYEGEIEEVCGGANPVVISWDSNSTDDEFLTSVCRIELLSETNYQFLDLFTSDDRKYRIRYYRNLNIKWTGFPLPLFYSEPFYTGENYIVNITASDQLGELKGMDFADDFGNPLISQVSYLDTIRMILRKIDMDITIRESINIFEQRMGVSYLDFQNQSFENGTLYPWININNGGTGYNFQWIDGNFAQSDPPSGSYDGAPALSQNKVNGQDWAAGFYTVVINASQSGATNGMGVILYGFDDASGSGLVAFGAIGVIDDGGSGEISGTVEVTSAKQFLGVGFIRQGPTGLHEVNVLSINITQGPEFTVNSSLQQSFFDPKVYYDNDGVPNKCDYVLRMLLRTWFSRIYQAEGRWNIELIEQKTGTVAYRDFDLSGTLLGSGDDYPLATITAPQANETHFVHRSQTLTIPAYFNKVIFNIRNFYDGNLLERGKFYKGDIFNGQIIGWGFDISNSPGVSYGYQTRNENKKENVILNKRRLGQLSLSGRNQITPEIRSEIVEIEDGCLFVDFSNTQSGAYIIIIAEPFELAPISGSDLVFKFDVLMLPYYIGFPNYIDVSIKIGDRFVCAGKVPQTDVLTNGLLVDDEYMRFYISDPLKWSTITKDISTTLRDRVTGEYENITLEGEVLIKIRISNHPNYEYESLAALQDLTTDNKLYLRNFDFKASVFDSSIDTIRVYEFLNDNLATDSPDVLRADDYSGTNLAVWKQLKSFKEPDTLFLMSGVLIDEISLSIKNEDVEELIYQKSFNPDIKQNVEKDLIHTDVAIFSEDIENPDFTNSNDARLVSNYIRLANSEPTKRWARSYVEGFTGTLPTIDDFTEGFNGPGGSFTGEDWDLTPYTVDFTAGLTTVYSKPLLFEIFGGLIDVDYTIEYEIEHDLTGGFFRVFLWNEDFTDSVSDGTSISSLTFAVTLRPNFIPKYLGFRVQKSPALTGGEVQLNDFTFDVELPGGEAYSLVDLLMKMYQGQFAFPRYAFDGSVMNDDNDLSPYNIFEHPLVSKFFSPISFVLNDKHQIYDCRLTEVRTGDNGLPPGDIYEFTEEFTTEFVA